MSELLENIFMGVCSISQSGMFEALLCLPLLCTLVPFLGLRLTPPLSLEALFMSVREQATGPVKDVRRYEANPVLLISRSCCFY